MSVDNIDKNGAVELADVNKKLKVIYKTDEKFKWRLIYSPDNDGYICLEPQTCMVNCVNMPFDNEFSGFDYIKPRGVELHKV